MMIKQELTTQDCYDNEKKNFKNPIFKTGKLNISLYFLKIFFKYFFISLFLFIIGDIIINGSADDIVAVTLGALFFFSMGGVFSTLKR